MNTNETNDRVEFDSKIDDIVDAHMRVAHSTDTFARQRRQQVIWSGLAVVVTAPLTFLYKAQQALGHAPPMSVVIGVVTATVVSGMVIGYFAGRYFDWRVARYVRRTLNERYSGATHVRLEVEIRAEGLWCRSSGIETTVPWGQLTRATDTPAAIELWFGTSGFVRLPSRAFSNGDQRRNIIQRIEALAPQANRA